MRGGVSDDRVLE